MNNEIKIGSNRSFGLVFFIVFFIIAIFPLKNDGDLRYWSILVSLIFLILGLINSNILSPLNKVWFKFGLLLGKIISPIVIGIIFFIVITPTSLLLKLFNKDILNLKRGKKKTYWIEKKGYKSKMKNQF